MPVYQNVPYDETIPFNTRRRKEKLAMFLVIFLFFFCFSSLAWYFHEKPNSAPCSKRLIGYYRGWGDSPDISTNALEKLTHIIFSTAVMDKSGNVNFGGAFREKSFLEFSKNLKTVNSKLKVIVAIGKGSLASMDFLIEPETSNGTWTESILNFVEKYEIDGIEIQWRSWPKEETIHALQIVHNIREGLNQLAKSKNRSEPYLLALAVSSSSWINRDFLKLDDLLDTVDFINIANLPERRFSRNYSREPTMESFACATDKWDKINMDLEFYGKVWKNSTVTEDVFWTIRKPVPWREIKNSNESSWNEELKSPYILNSTNLEYIGFENEKSLVEKMKYIEDNNFGGVTMTWLNFDDDQNTLLNAVTSVDLCSRGQFEIRKIKCDE